MNKYEDIINSCSNLVYWVINRYFKGFDREDLYQVGVIGIIKAYNNYTEDKNVKFSTYAYKYIYGEIYSYINSDKTVKTNRDSNRLYKKVNEARNILCQKLMKEPTVEELASFLEIDKFTILSIMKMHEGVESLDRIIYEDGKSISLFDMIGDSKDYYNIDYMMLSDEIKNLPEDEKKLLYLRYFEDRTQSEVASILGMNQVAISRMEAKTLKKIKKDYQNVA